jgi:hypothetical protein
MIRTELRGLLEGRTGVLLLIAGGLLSVQIVLRELPAFAGPTVRAGLPGWGRFALSAGLLGLVGLGLPFVALGGLYYRLRSETPRLAVAGGALMALTPVLFSGGLFLLIFLRPRPEFRYLLWLSPLSYVVGVGTFGVAFLRTDGSTRFVGIPLLVFSGTWALTYAVGLDAGELPGWVPFVELLAVSLVAMGYLLYADSTGRTSGVPLGS